MSLSLGLLRKHRKLNLSEYTSLSVILVARRTCAANLRCSRLVSNQSMMALSIHLLARNAPSRELGLSLERSSYMEGTQLSRLVVCCMFHHLAGMYFRA